MNNYLRIGIVVLGGLAGYLYYYFIGCNSGACAIQSNPYVSTTYGAVLSAILVFPVRKKKSEDNKENTN